MISLSVRACLFRKVIKGNEFTYSSYNSGVRGVSLPPSPSLVSTPVLLTSLKRRSLFPLELAFIGSESSIIANDYC